VSFEIAVDAVWIEFSERFQGITLLLDRWGWVTGRWTGPRCRKSEGAARDTGDSL